MSHSAFRQSLACVSLLYQQQADGRGHTRTQGKWVFALKSFICVLNLKGMQLEATNLHQHILSGCI
jgi:hypothetical protein